MLRFHRPLEPEYGNKEPVMAAAQRGKTSQMMLKGSEVSDFSRRIHIIGRMQLLFTLLRWLKSLHGSTASTAAESEIVVKANGPAAP